MPSFTVYRLYDGDHHLMYVGLTRDLPQRLRQHYLRRGEWSALHWDNVAIIETEEYKSRNQAEAAERRYVRTWFPKWRLEWWKRGRREPVKRQEPGQRAGKILIRPEVSREYIRQAYERGEALHLRRPRPLRKAPKRESALQLWFPRPLGEAPQDRTLQLWLSHLSKKDLPERNEPDLECVTEHPWEQLAWEQFKFLKSGEYTRLVASTPRREVKRHPVAYIGRWGALLAGPEKDWSRAGLYPGQYRIPRPSKCLTEEVEVAQKAKLEGLNEVLAEVGGVDVGVNGEQLDDDARARLHEALEGEVADIVADESPALPWIEAYRYVKRVLDRGERLTREERFVLWLQLANLLKRVRHRGEVKWTNRDRADDERKEAKFTQGRAAKLCDLSPRTLKTFENFNKSLEVPSETTLRKVWVGIHRLVAESRRLEEEGMNLRDSELAESDYHLERLKWLEAVEGGRDTIHSYLVHDQATFSASDRCS